ncbi:hypothetical protein [Thalassobacillus pellis]|uniref:hypothetical protein n=1 Tax=Thalassobacillus pellis TaxID=748008 RepID=UPI001961AB59|nr:hypothetical protein [Thalassobacillus pellis]MBM7552640.1 putative membrane protein YedE/YeeE [Thalassobacillus pellis]
MIRVAVSIMMSFVLLVIESTIVMAIKDYETIYFDDYSLLATVLALNFFYTFTLLTNIKLWINNNYEESDSQFNKL